MPNLLSFRCSIRGLRAALAAAVLTGAMLLAAAPSRAGLVTVEIGGVVTSDELRPFGLDLTGQPFTMTLELDTAQPSAPGSGAIVAAFNLTQAFTLDSAEATSSTRWAAVSTQPDPAGFLGFSFLRVEVFGLGLAPGAVAPSFTAVDLANSGVRVEVFRAGSFDPGPPVRCLFDVCVIEADVTSFSAVPEPSALLLLGAGLAAIARGRRA